jgi:hypothetical protein
MALSSLGSLQLTLRELKQIIVGITGEEHDLCLLAVQMEELAAEIARKSGGVADAAVTESALPVGYATLS